MLARVPGRAPTPEAQARQGKSFSGLELSLKWLTYAEEDIEMAHALRQECRRRRLLRAQCISNGIRCRIQIVPEVEAQWADRCLVTQSKADGVRGVIIAGIVELGNAAVVLRRRGSGAVLQTLRGIWLMPAHEAFNHVVTGGENITHIVKNSEAKTFSKVWQAHLGKAQFLAIHKLRRTTDGKTGIGIAGSCLI